METRIGSDFFSNHSEKQLCLVLTRVLNAIILLRIVLNAIILLILLRMRSREYTFRKMALVELTHLTHLEELERF